MGEELNRSLEMLAKRGVPRGAAAVLEEARAEAAAAQAVPDRPTWRRGLAVALATAVGVFAVVGAVILIARPFAGEEVHPVTTEAPVVPTTVPVTPPPGGAATGPLNDVNDLALAPDGHLWAATAAGLVQWDITAGEFSLFTEGDGLPGRSFATIDISPDGTVWIVGDQGIGRYDGAWQIYSEENTTELAGQLGGLVVDHDGVVWATVASEPLARFDGSWSSVTAPEGPGRSVVGPDGLAVGTDGTLWVGTHDQGVFAFDGSTWQHFTEADGAPERAWHIAVAPDGAVWAWDEGYYTSSDLEEYVPGTGFARYDGSTWTTYTVDDGLLSSEGYVAVTGDGSVAVIHRVWGPDHEEILLGVSRFDGEGWTTLSAISGDSYGPIGATAFGADGTIWMPSATGIYGFGGADTVELAVPVELATPPVASWTVVPDPEQAPIQISSVIGNLEFTAVKPSPSRDIFFVAGTPFGAVIPADDRLYWSEDYVTWYGTNLRREQQWLTTDGPDLVGFGDGFTRYSWTGQGWVEGASIDLPGVLQDIAFGPDGAVALVDSTVYYSTDGLNFIEAELGPEAGYGAGLCFVEAAPPIAGDGIGPILVTEAGYVILGSVDATWDSRASQLCDPLAWFSADGKVWELRTPESPFGPRAAVWDVAAHEGRFVAIGSPWDEPATNVWISDDGIEWRQIEVPRFDSALGVAGGELGWFLSGHSTSDGGDLTPADMWFSADGLVWDGPYEGPAGLFWAFFRDEPAVGSDVILSVNGTHDGLVIGRLHQ